MWKLAEEVKEQQEYLMAKSRIEFASYVELAVPGWIRAPHLDYVCQNIQEFLEGERQTELGEARILILSLPPQHGKSITITETLPSWYLGKNPTSRTILISYGEELALRFGRRNKEKIAQFGETLWGVSLSKHKKSDASFELSNNIGSILSRGIGASIGGNPAELIIIDDPIKNRQQAESTTYRNFVWDEFLNTIYTRLSARGKIILIMTRWHEDDLAGRLIDSKILPTIVINLPCEAEENDVLGRKVGAPLFPEEPVCKDEDWLAQTKKMYLDGANNDIDAMGSGPTAWNAIFQGHPSSKQGNMFKRNWWQFYETVPSEFDDSCLSIDAAFKGGEEHDFVVIQAWGKFGSKIYLIDQIRDHMTFTETVKAIRMFSAMYPYITAKLIEDKANGPAIIDTLQTELQGIIAVNPKGSKESRASAVTPLVEAGNVYLPKYRSWVNDYIEELAKFPRGSTDDMVDGTSMALGRLMHSKSIFRKTHPPGEGYWSPKEIEAYNERNNIFAGGIHRAGKRRPNNDRKSRIPS